MDGKKLLDVLVNALVIAFTILFILLVAMYTGGCSKQEAPLQYESRLKFAGMSGTTLEVWIDTETGICYLAQTDGGLAVMVDHDGKPYVANGWRDFGSDD